jgi:PAS domain S-box-containing protein
MKTKGNPGQILIVDDKIYNLRILSMYLQKCGYVLDQLQNPELVLPLVKKSPPDIILLDIMMPKINGYEVCKQLKADASISDIPVIFLSALHDSSDVLNAFSVGGVDYITKPFKEYDVLARVQTHISLRKSQQALKIKNIELQNEIEARERIENKLLESKKNFEDIFNSTTDILFIVDFQGNIQDANPKAIETYGYSKDELLKLDVRQLVHKDSQHIFDKVITEILTKGYSCHESTDLKNDGSTFIAEVQGSIVQFNGTPHYLAVIRDITRRKQTEKALITAKNASDAANKAKSNFLAVMSHEIRTPMNAIIGMTELTLQTDLNSKQINNLKIIKDSSYHLLNVINEILDFSKIEANKLSIEAINYDLYALLYGVIYLFKGQIKEKGLFLNLEKAETLPKFINGDPIRLKQILVNLVNNAIKFTRTGGITIKAMYENDSYLLFSVTDTGIGIPENKHQSIFDSFNQADNSVTRNHGGTGLGLAICKKLSEMMGGNVTVSSTPGSGSTFSFRIKYQPGDKNEMSPLNQHNDWKQLKEDTCPLNILLVEDNHVNANIAKQFLEKMGHDSVTALNGKEALEVLSIQTFDIVLMDVEMPEMNGLEATRRIRNGEAGEHVSGIPVIAMTAHALNEFRDECMHSGMNDFISKPVDFYELGIVLKKYCATSPSKQSNDLDPQQHNSNNHIINKNEAMQRLDDSEELFDMICNSFLDDIDDPLKNMNQAISSKDYECLRYNAHTLKGLCGNIGANRCKEMMFQIEKMAGSDYPDRDQLRSFYENFLVELEKVKEILS